jgi:glycosyltransferase involved in cell wall biosynthesis
MTERLRRQVADLGLDENVVFTGHRTDMRRLLGACDIFTMPSFEEPFGLVFAEAMAMSKPVVALSSGGALEVVADGETGLLSPPGDAVALADNISLLLGDPALRDRMGRAGRERVERLFRPERLCEDYAAFYRALVPRHRTRA